ncbi:hypothetical protein [Longispora albida]|uniref:hypothetical protein n=1 Tax=Longispora albida TaxID=203523 RepID=UPI00037E9D45|nr:hypothetical protein [Longispora albida]
MTNVMMLPASELVRLLERTPQWENEEIRLNWRAALKLDEKIRFWMTSRQQLELLYRERLQRSLEEGQVEVSDCLAEALGKLENSRQEEIAFAVIGEKDRGSFVWLTSDMSDVVAYFQLEVSGS